MKVFSGIRPSGQLHIGNYLGAIKQWLALQGKNKCVFCIVDLHAITTPYEPNKLQGQINETAAVYLTAGLDSKKSIIFVQSKIKEHAELAWLLSAITPLGDLQRMTQFKEKSIKHKESVNAGLLNYPILMAADILLYDTDIVPVGVDQKQHVELAREMVRKFNKKFGKTFKIPQAMISKTGAKIMSLSEPDKKMSKTDNPESCIFLFDSPEAIKKKISSATTDSGKEIKCDPENKPGVSNLLVIYSLFSDKPINELEKKFSGQGYAAFKNDLAKLLIEKLEPFRQKKKWLEKNPRQLEKVLSDGAKRAQRIAAKKITEVKKKMALI